MNNNRSMFQGRNGSDPLSVFLVAIALVLVIIYPFFAQSIVRVILCLIALALSAWSVFRMLSTNVAKRRYENDKFVSFFTKGKGERPNVEDASFRDSSKKSEKEARKEEKRQEKARKEARKEDEKTHCYFKCPKCSAELRVPKGKGKIKITCPKCGEQFVENT